MAEILEKLKVLDFSSGWPGSIATMVLSDFGAEVIKVEPPEGDPIRKSPQGLLWNRGKKSIVLDITTQDGQEKAQKLAQLSDVVVESFTPGLTKTLGIDYETLISNKPDLVYCSITSFGPKGPYAGYKPYEGIVAAKSGRYTVFSGQTKRQGPHYAAVNIANHGTAMATIRGIIAALIVRDKTGHGQKVETSLLQGISHFDITNWLIWQMMLKFPDRFQEDPQSDPNRKPGVGYQPIRTKDGHWIQMANIIVRLFRASMESMELGDLMEDPKFKGAPTLMEGPREELRRIIIQKGLEKTLDEWMDIFVNQTSNVAAEPFRMTQDGLTHPQVEHNPHVVEVDDSRVGKMSQLGVLVSMSETPGTVKGQAPEIGQHSEEILSRINGHIEKPQKKSDSALPKHPLEGFTILDMSTVIAGPLSTSLSHELGARVIRIETLEGDTTRRNYDGLGANRTQAGAENISINLQTPEGKDILNRLVANVDILVHNMRPGAPERLGAGYEQVKAINPNIVYVYAGGYGDSGPHSHRPAMHPIGGAVIGGALNQLGRNVMPSPETDMSIEEIEEMGRRLGRANETNPDPNSSAVISAAILLGLYARERLGTAQYVLSTMLGANAYANADDFFSYEGKPERLIPDGDGYGLHSLYRLYQAKNGWIFLACTTDQEWNNLCEAVDIKDLSINPLFNTVESRLKNDDQLASALGQLFTTKSARDWESLLTEQNVACVEAEESSMFYFYSNEPHLKENGFIREVENLRLGKYWRYGPVVDLSLTPARVGSGPLRGQHTQKILTELGYTEQDIKGLQEKSIISWEDVNRWGDVAH
jgi:crotonobetainyl-CoA:carnitine CoA-transferase CaiB-like acyl-CoA transferase